MSSLQRLVNLLQWNSMTSSHIDFNEIVIMTSKAHAFDFLHFSQSTSMKNEFITYNDTRANDMTRRIENIESIDLLFSQISSFFSQSFVRRRQWFSVSESAVNQNAPINKNSKNSNSRNLKQHTLAKSISLCCFCFCLILKHRSFHHTNLQIFSRSRFSTRFSFSWFYIFRFRTFFSVFAIFFSCSSYLLWNFQRQLWSNRYLINSQWISLQCRTMRKMNSRFGTKLEKNETIMLRACLKSRLKTYFISGNSYEN